MLLKFYICSDFLYGLLRLTIIISFQVYFFSRICSSSLQTIGTQVAAYYFCIFLLLHYLPSSHYVPLKPNCTKQGTRTNSVVNTEI